MINFNDKGEDIMSTIRYSSEVIFKKFEQLEVQIDPEQKSVWLYLNSQPRSCFSVTLLEELKKFQSILKHNDGKLSYEGQLVDIEFSIFTSRHPVFSFGGDLELFIKCIEDNNREALIDYAKLCIDGLYANYIGRDVGLTTISLIHGNALGGGFECALSGHVLIAERSAEMGFPEVLFNLFPGMGAFNLLTKRVSPAMAEKMMTCGRLYSVDELYSMGIVDQVVEDGEGKAAVDSFIRTNKKRRSTMSALKKVHQLVYPVDYDQLIEIADIWVDSAFDISEKDLRTMSRLVKGQRKFAETEAVMPLSRLNDR